MYMPVVGAPLRDNLLQVVQVPVILKPHATETIAVEVPPTEVIRVVGVVICLKRQQRHNCNFL